MFSLSKKGDLERLFVLIAIIGTLIVIFAAGISVCAKRLPRRSSTPPPPPPEIPQTNYGNEEDINAFLRDYERSIEDHDIYSLMNCYSPDFTKESMNYDQYRAYMSDFFDQFPYIDVTITGATYETYPNNCIRLTFYQKLHLKNNNKDYTDSGHVQMLLSNDSGRLQILSESWQAN
ncbi:MAG: hypothetical protein JW765_05355 [Deltaproteobacteria bacterium]|nr:hypothetical protein [Candidatus Zymogenaceae bacterium]